MTFTTLKGQKPQKQLMLLGFKEGGGRSWIRTSGGVSQQIYSLFFFRYLLGMCHFGYFVVDFQSVLGEINALKRI